MRRLGVFLAATLVVLYAVLTIYGTGDQRRPAVSEARTDTEDQARSTAEETGLLPSLTTQSVTNEPPAAEVVQVATQTPQQVQDFPGPPLQPSPEHAHQSTAQPAPPPPGAEGTIFYVTGTRVNFRAGPSTGDRVIGALNAGAAVEVLGPTDASWVNIRDADGRIGYISGQFLVTEAPN